MTGKQLYNRWWLCFSGGHVFPHTNPYAPDHVDEAAGMCVYEGKDDYGLLAKEDMGEDI